MPDTDFELSRRKALAALGTIGVASAGAGLGTSAYFSDQETFENNSLVAGTLDMGVGYTAHYSDWSPDEDGGDTATTDDDVDVIMYDGAPDTVGDSTDLAAQAPAGYTGLPANDAWLIAVDDPDQFLTNTQTDVYPNAGDTDGDGVDDQGPVECVDNGAGALVANAQADDAPRPVIELSDVKPGDFGEVTFDFVLCDNPGYVWLTGNLVSESENGLTEPEADDPDEGEGVELLDVVQAAVWVDDGNNYQNGDEGGAMLATGSLRSVLGMVDDSLGTELTGTMNAEAGGGTGEQGCFGANTTHSVAFAWWVPVDHGNEIQSDSATFDLGLYTEQCRHNDGEGMPPEIAQVEMADQESDGTTVTVDSVGLPRDGYVVIHDARLAGGQPLDSVIGVSDYLSAGVHDDVSVTLFTGVPGQSQSTFDASPFPDTNTTLIAMPHEETGGDQSYDFVASGASEDPPFVDADGNPVVDPATVTVPDS